MAADLHLSRVRPHTDNASSSTDSEKYPESGDGKKDRVKERVRLKLELLLLATI